MHRSSLVSRRVPLALCLLSSIVFTSPAIGQQVLLPLEVCDGLLFTERAPRPYVASLNLSALYRLASQSSFRVGPTVSLAYANPDASFQVGGRAQVQISQLKLAVFTAAELSLAAEALWGTKDRNPVGGVLIFSVNRLLQLGVRGGYDLDQDAGYAGVALGTDLSFFLGINDRVGPETPVREPFVGCAFEIFVEAKVQTLAAFDDEGFRDRTSRFLGDNDSKDEFLNQQSLASAGQFLQSKQLDLLASQVATVPGSEFVQAGCEDTELDEKSILRVFTEAWDVAIELTD